MFERTPFHVQSVGNLHVCVVREVEVEVSVTASAEQDDAFLRCVIGSLSCCLTRLDQNALLSAPHTSKQTRRVVG